MRQNLNELPSDLPRPNDDGLTDHLKGYKIPNIKLESTKNVQVDLWEAFQNPTVLFIFPRAGSPLETNSNPELWDSIPGARGCTPQSCGFRDLIQDFDFLKVKVYGLSVQPPIVLNEFAQRMHISFPLLSDYQYLLTDLLKLPTFEFDGSRLIKRMALFIKEGEIKKVFYPIFPPNKNAEEVLAWLKNQ